MAIAVTIVGILAALGWVPVFRHFWKSWRARNNPISLAICGMVGFNIYLNSAIYLFMYNDPVWVAIVIGGVNIAILVNFYFSFRMAKKKFPDAISRGSGTDPLIRVIGGESSE